MKGRQQKKRNGKEREVRGSEAVERERNVRGRLMSENAEMLDD
jgi:hypothetical protein